MPPQDLRCASFSLAPLPAKRHWTFRAPTHLPSGLPSVQPWLPIQHSSRMPFRSLPATLSLFPHQTPSSCIPHRKFFSKSCSKNRSEEHTSELQSQFHLL